VYVTKLVDRPLAGVRAEGGVLTGRFRRGSSPAARVKGPERFTKSMRTCGWAWEAEGMVGTVLSAVEQFVAAKGNGGDGALAVEGGRRVAGELRESKLELGVGSVRVEQPWRSGATVSSSSSAFGWPVAAFWGYGSGSWRGK
jgi:hypothetical protein